MPSQAKALGNARDTLTRRGRVFGMAWVLEKGQGFMAHVSDVVKASCPKSALAKRLFPVTV